MSAVNGEVGADNPEEPREKDFGGTHGEYYKYMGRCYRSTTHDACAASMAPVWIRYQSRSSENHAQVMCASEFYYLRMQSERGINLNFSCRRPCFTQR